MTSLAVHRGQTPVQNKGNAKIYVDETFLRFSTTVIMVHGSFDNANTLREGIERLLRTTKSTIRKLLQKTTWGKIKFKLLFFKFLFSFFLFSHHLSKYTGDAFLFMPRWRWWWCHNGFFSAQLPFFLPTISFSTPHGDQHLIVGRKL